MSLEVAASLGRVTQGAVLLLLIPAVSQVEAVEGTALLALKPRVPAAMGALDLRVP